MFDIGFAELLILSLVALLVLGPERLPGALRTLGLWIGRMRRTVGNLQAELEREIGMDELRRELHNNRILDEARALERDLKDTDRKFRDETRALEGDLRSVSGDPAKERKALYRDSGTEETSPSSTEAESEARPEARSETTSEAGSGTVPALDSGTAPERERHGNTAPTPPWEPDEERERSPRDAYGDLDDEDVDPGGSRAPRADAGTPAPGREPGHDDEDHGERSGEHR